MHFSPIRIQTLCIVLGATILLALITLAAWYFAAKLPLLAVVETPAEEVGTDVPFITFVDPIGGSYSVYQPLHIRLTTGTFVGDGSVQYELVKDGPESNANRPDDTHLYLGTKSLTDGFSGELELTIEASELFSFAPEPGVPYVILASPHDYSEKVTGLEFRSEPFTFLPISKAPECWLSVEEITSTAPGYGFVDGIITVGEPYLIKQHLLDVTEGYFLPKKVEKEAYEFYYGICDREPEDCRPFQTWSAAEDKPGYQNYTLIARGPFGKTSCELSVEIIAKPKF